MRPSCADLVDTGPGHHRTVGCKPQHGALVDHGRNLGPKRRRVLQQRLVDRFQARHLLPHARVVEPAGGAKVYPPGAEVADGLLPDVADQLPVRILQRADRIDRAGEVSVPR
jgi:hypothetical protein